MTDFVLAHSPHGGSYTWEPVAELLRSRGHQATIVAYPVHAGAPFWPQHLSAIVRSIRDERTLVVAHSGAGPLLAPARALRPFRAVYVDAGFRKDARPAAGMSLVERGSGFTMVWANMDDLAELLPDADTRRRLIASMTPLPREHFAEGIPYHEPPDGSAYVLLSPPYAEPATAARAKGWPVRELAGENHYLMLADPALVADTLIELMR